MLGFFKYFNFFADNLRALFAARRLARRLRHAARHPADRHLVLHVHDDQLRHRRLSPRDRADDANCLDFALFVAYFPHLVAGPILRASLLLPQIARPRTITARADLTAGLWLIGVGLLQEDVRRRQPGAAGRRGLRAVGRTRSGLDVLLGVYAFAFQIYGDFSGYSDIARGLSQLMGIELNVNFRFPYFVRDAAGVLAALAHQPVHLAARLPLHPARRQPRLGVAQTHRNLHDHDGARRAVARRGVDVRAVGRLSGRCCSIAYRDVPTRTGRGCGRGAASRASRVARSALAACSHRDVLRLADLPRRVRSAKIARLTRELFDRVWRRRRRRAHALLVPLAGYGSAARWRVHVCQSAWKDRSAAR